MWKISQTIFRTPNNQLMTFMTKTFMTLLNGKLFVEKRVPYTDFLAVIFSFIDTFSNGDGFICVASFSISSRVVHAA